MSLAEPAVTLTDYALALECAALAWLVFRQPRDHGDLRRWFVVFFSALGLAAMTGGTVHGFFHDETSIIQVLLWKSTLIAIGVAALAAWMIAATLLAREPASRRVRAAAITLFSMYVLAVSFVDSFLIAIVHYLPATVFLLIVYGLCYLRSHERCFLLGVTGLALTFAAAGVQQARFGLHPAWLDHNALYHVIQGIALLFLFASARGILRRREA